MIFVWIYIGIAVLWLRPIFRYAITEDEDSAFKWGPPPDGETFCMILLMTAYGAALWALLLIYILIRKSAYAISGGGDFHKLSLKLAGQGKEAKKLSYDQLLQRNKELEEELRVGHED